MKEEIKRLAIRLFTLNGYRGVSFGDLTDELGTTRANIHYHFGSKSGLAEAVLDAAAADVVDTYKAIWTNKKISLKKKLERSYLFNAGRYGEYNSDGEGIIWSLITRFRIDRDVITPHMVARLNSVTLLNEESVSEGVRIAVSQGELRADAPIDEISCLISNVLHFAPLISQAPHDLSRLKQTYEALGNSIERAYAAAPE